MAVCVEISEQKMKDSMDYYENTTRKAWPRFSQCGRLAYQRLQKTAGNGLQAP